jgi:hypothetical protein
MSYFVLEYHELTQGPIFVTDSLFWRKSEQLDRPLNYIMRDFQLMFEECLLINQVIWLKFSI